MRVVLVDISPISTHEVVESSHKPPLACIVCEVISFYIMYKHMAGDVLNAGDLPTLIH